MTDAIRVKITDNLHIYELAHCGGLLEAVELLKALPATVRGTPGVALAIATIEAEANSQRVSSVGRNLSVIAKAGHDVSRYRSISYDARAAELICEFYEPDLFDSGAEAS